MGQEYGKQQNQKKERQSVEVPERHFLRRNCDVLRLKKTTNMEIRKRNYIEKM